MKTKPFILIAALCGIIGFVRAQDLDSIAPVVVKTVPESGAKDVSPGITEIKVTFSKEMADGSWSWATAWENSSPEIIGKPHYEADHKTCVIKVKLEPGTTYGWWLNSQKFHNFQDTKHHPSVPYLLTFATGTTTTHSSSSGSSSGRAPALQAGMINPVNGLPASGAAGSSHGIDAATGLPSGALNPATGLRSPVPSANPPVTAMAFKINQDELHAAKEIWSPTLAPDEKPDLQKIREEITSLMDQGQYEDALQHQLWYFNHALEFGEANPVRTSFGIMNWAELGRRYPKARQAMIEIRDAETREFTAGRGNAQLFLEIQSLNRELPDEDATVTLFKQISQQDKQLTHQCYYFAQDLLIKKGEYALLLESLGDPQSQINMLCRALESQRQIQQRVAAFRVDHPAPMMPTSYNPPPDMGKMATNNFVGQVRKLVEILVANDRVADAEKIRDQAVTSLDDERLRLAVADAVVKTKK